MRSDSSSNQSNLPSSPHHTPEDSHSPLKKRSIRRSVEGLILSSAQQEDTPDDTPRDESSQVSQLSRELDALREQNNTVVQSMNDLKTKLNQKIMDLGDATNTISLLREKVKYLQAELANVKQEKDGLMYLNNDLQNRIARTTKGSSKFLSKISALLDKKYINLATVLERRLCEWSTAESMEVLEATGEVKTRNWTGRVQHVTEFGLSLSSSSGTPSSPLCTPFPFTYLVSSKDLFFTHSFDSHESVIEENLCMVLDDSKWNSFTSSPRFGNRL